MKLEIEAMLKTGGGSIVNASSVNRFSSSLNAAMYSATKHGINGLTAAAAKETVARGNAGHLRKALQKSKTAALKTKL